MNFSKNTRMPSSVLINNEEREIKEIKNILKKYFIDFDQIGLENIKFDIKKGLIQLGFDAYGVDISKWAVEHAVCKQIVNADARDLPYPIDYFDIVISQDFMEHAPADDLFILISELTRITKPGGSMFHFIPFSNNIQPQAEFVHLTNANKEWWDNFFNSHPKIKLIYSPSEKN